MHKLFLFLLAASLNAMGQLFLKSGAKAMASVNSASGWASKLISTFLQPAVMAGIVCYVAGLSIWLFILSRFQVSTAYPINVALTIFFTSVIGIMLFNESLSLYKILGTALIISGIALLTLRG